MSNLSKQEIIKELWRRGELSWKLDPVQKQLYELYYNSEFKVQTWLLARRSGKSYALCVLALEQCIRKPNSIVKYVAPTKTQINNIIRPLLRILTEDCPEDVKPEFKAKDYIYYFPNGSEIQLAGTDNQHAEKLRGGDSHVAFVDEAGSCADLDYVIKSILLPTTLVTNGKIILASTPPNTPDHDFIRYIEEAELRGSLVKKTVFDNPRLTDHQRKELIDEMGGLETESARRELLCHIVRDANVTVVPEFTVELEKEVVQDWPIPPFYDAYVAMDIGGKDLTALLFGYFDFRADKVIIQDEIVFDFRKKENTLPKLVQMIQEKEEKLWFNHLTNEQRIPYVRVSDINYIVIEEIRRSSYNKLNFQVAKKDDKKSAVNRLRDLLNNKKIIIDPKCTNLIRHLKNVKWSKKENTVEFARSPDEGHYDTVDALIYFIRSVVYNKNPYPREYGISMKDVYIQNREKFNEARNTIEVLKNVFGRKKSL